ncbi:cell division cycle-associated protein 3 isoform X1 [Marmota monax]|uniref:Cell division cycle associated 3 n=2 Tax=Marmota TaxID=9992 RepID=A0A8C5ZVQ0_MARMA|nr:cell division cycle-associated protein 3 isoform X1 [Marmota marmota marmota]XP_046280096.1 cell division cycle-associated protein 3 isoform X1 [Marmota monax]KAI6049677.1 CDCA3 [Marmota monax]KAI6059936.1 CDCA3 [Marmota monax]
MGSAKSVPVTPARAPPHNKHLARVADPRSPSAGIQRTPIQVESSPQSSLPAGEQLKCPKQALDSDPRSPTLGIARTPMKTSSADPQSPVMRELSEVFESEASKSDPPPESVLPLGVPSSSELDLPLDTQLSLEDQVLPWNDTELPSKQVSSQEDARHPTETPVASQSSDKLSKDPESPRSSGSKRSRRKPNKVLGRSPLTILQDDNSPGTLTPRQGKRPSPLSENVRELKEGAILGTGRLLKTGGRAWEQGQDHDKENQHFALVES